MFVSSTLTSEARDLPLSCGLTSVELLSCFVPQVVFAYHSRIFTKYVDLFSLGEIASDIFLT